MKIAFFTAALLYLFVGSCKLEKTKTIAMMINLVNDSTVIRQYEDYHKNPWPRIAAANKAAGIQQIEIFRL